MITSDEMAERIKAEIISDVHAGIVPADIVGFDDLHRYIDANTYGGAEELFGEVVTESASDDEHQAKLDIVNAIMTPAIQTIDVWIQRGGLKAKLMPDTRRTHPEVNTISVYRRKEPTGLGHPQAFLGTDHPLQGDWHRSAKAVLIDGDPHWRLHQMGRDFLIYSMYHAREPQFLGYAIAHFAAACEKLGYKLPLKEEDAVWLTYTKEELNPGSPDEQIFLVGRIAAVFGAVAARDQATALGLSWPFPSPS